jgi:hypothetical protein
MLILIEAKDNQIEMTTLLHSLADYMVLIVKNVLKYIL